MMYAKKPLIRVKRLLQTVLQLTILTWDVDFILLMKEIVGN